MGGELGGYRHAETIARDPPDAQALGGWRLPLRLGAEQVARLRARLLGLRQVQVHLVAVEVGVVRRAHALVKP